MVRPAVCLYLLAQLISPVYVPVHAPLPPTYLLCGLLLPPCSAQITDAFIAAHSGRKVTKKWVGDMLRDSAEWKGTVNGWALKPAALQLLDPSAGALAAAAALASGSTPLAPVAAQAAAAAAVGCGAGLAAASAAPHSVAEAASSPHFGATRHTDGSSIARFFNFKSGKVRCCQQGRGVRCRYDIEEGMLCCAVLRCDLPALPPDCCCTGGTSSAPGVTPSLTFNLL